MMREWKDPDGTAAAPAGLPVARGLPRMRLTAARGLEALADPAAFAAFVVELVNDRGDKPAWKIPAATVDALAELLVHGEPPLRARTARLLRHLDADGAGRLGPGLGRPRGPVRRRSSPTAAAGGPARKPAPLRYSPAELRELAFGAYVGLVREQGGSRGKGAGRRPRTPQVIRVRQTALGRLLALARSDPPRRGAARPVFVQALGDPNQAVRLQAFEHLQALGVAPAALAAEALATGHTDLGVKGLELLSGGGSEPEGRAVLERAMLSRKDDLAIEAARLLIARRGAGRRRRPGAGGGARAAAHAGRRLAGRRVRQGRGRPRPAPPGPRLAVRGGPRGRRAASWPPRRTRPRSRPWSALLAAAGQPDPQHRVIQALVTLGDPRGRRRLPRPAGERPGGTALGRRPAPGRRPVPPPRGRRPAARPCWRRTAKRREAAFAAVLTISGYDQAIDDPEDERPDRPLGGEAVPAPRRRAGPADGAARRPGTTRGSWPA